ncbi:hypothetical protein NDU88_000842 [Pleurodeles waltl]|uniref:Uncharacterized protein n=1 Tax=Pleurodeles waltl TaxID=8319 RepID=A0AAV7Q8F7_PLEWA|nr:hypothetical protein NDU88_000842 [Pleurodeles waltl]
MSLGQISTFLLGAWQPILGVAAHVRLGELELDDAQARPEGTAQEEEVLLEQEVRGQEEAAVGQAALDEQLLLEVARQVLGQLKLEEPELEQSLPGAPQELLETAVQARLAAAAREQVLLGEQAVGHEKLQASVPDLPEGAAHVRLAEERRAQVLLVDPVTEQELEPPARGQVKLRAPAAGQDVGDGQPQLWLGKALEEVLAKQSLVAHPLLGVTARG